MKRILLLLVLVATVAVIWWQLDPGQYLSFQALQSSRIRLTEWVNANPWLAALGYFAVYVGTTALSLPGATVLTLAGGAMFGLVWGTVLVSFASSLGATLAFLVSRYLARDWVQRRFGDQLATLNQGIANEGAFYLFSLRLVPYVPFFVVNLVMGLSTMRTTTFYTVSQLGMLIATVVYVNAGTQLAQLSSPADILSWQLGLALALLGLLPWLAKRILTRLRKKGTL